MMAMELLVWVYNHMEGCTCEQLQLQLQRLEEVLPGSQRDHVHDQTCEPLHLLLHQMMGFLLVEQTNGLKILMEQVQSPTLQKSLMEQRKGMKRLAEVPWRALHRLLVEQRKGTKMMAKVQRPTLQKYMLCLPRDLLLQSHLVKLLAASMRAQWLALTQHGSSSAAPRRPVSWGMTCTEGAGTLRGIRRECYNWYEQHLLTHVWRVAAAHFHCLWTTLSLAPPGHLEVTANET